MGVISRVVFKLLLLNLAGRLLLAKEKSSTAGSVTGEINFSTSCFSYLPLEIISRIVQFACMARDGNKSPRKQQQHCCWSSLRMLSVTAAAAQLLNTPASSRI